MFVSGPATEMMSIFLTEIPSFSANPHQSLVPPPLGFLRRLLLECFAPMDINSTALDGWKEANCLEEEEVSIFPGFSSLRNTNPSWR